MWVSTMVFKRYKTLPNLYAKDYIGRTVTVDLGFRVRSELKLEYLISFLDVRRIHVGVCNISVSLVKLEGTRATLKFDGQNIGSDTKFSVLLYETEVI